MFEDIQGHETWASCEKVKKGWSSDDKYLIVTKTGEKLLLRVNDIEKYDAKKKEYEIVQKFSKLGINMSMPVDFGTCNFGEKVYMLLTWVEGKDLEAVLPTLSESDQYFLGREAGSVLKKLHSVEVVSEDYPVTTKKDKKLKQLKAYEDSDLRVLGDEVVIKYVRSNIDAIWHKNPVYIHGDFHPGNLIFTEDGDIGVIDFNRWEAGDPYEEFYKTELYATETSIPFCIGLIDEYFNDNIPQNFWDALAVYSAQASLYSIKWAEQFGHDDVVGMIKRFHSIFVHYDAFRTTIPRWYRSNFFKTLNT